MKTLKWSLRDWLGLFLESACPLCQRSTPHAFCLDCQRQIQSCQMPLSGPLQSGHMSVVAWGYYQGALKRAIAALKYQNTPSLARILGLHMAQAWLTAHPSMTQLTVVPIPIHSSKKQQRGFDQAELLAQHFCKIARLPCQPQGLERIRATQAQFQLSLAGDRAKNLANAFSLGNAFLKHRPSTPVLLLDDIYTTGATAHSAAQILRRHGIRVHGIVVLARAGQGEGRRAKGEGRRMKDEG